MTAVLCRHFGLEHIEIAEDIASDTFLKASEHWALHGVPDNPTAWLYTVARNKAKDHLRHKKIAQVNAGGRAGTDVVFPGDDFEINDRIIADSQLAMIFAVCNPVNSPESQICLALQVLCGFSIEEIANAFLTNRETIKKRLQRARQHLRDNQFSLSALTPDHIQARQDAVLKTIYLLFNEGYFSRTNRAAIRKDLCSEAIRLALCLTESELTRTSQVYALLALMCYQSSRLEARINSEGELLLFDEQDKTQWDQQLIDRGNYYLVAATEGNELSKYHLEAAIAYWHTTDSKEKWSRILELYNQLVLIEYSPGTALGRAFAMSKVVGKEKVIAEVEKLKLEDNHHYYALLGYLYAEVDGEKAVRCYENAIELTMSEAERKVLIRESERLKNPKTEPL
jgi:RNA polymerase sigma-70 factor (ECF subfamily)